MKLSEAIRALPAKLFPKIDGEKRPDYKGIFVEAVSALLESRKVKFQRETLEKIAEHVNLSTFQRQAALECARRYGTMNDKGERINPPPAVPKPKKTGVAAIDGKPKRVDPITGEPIKAAPKTKKSTKPEKAAKAKSPAPKKATAKPAAPKAKPTATPKPAAPKKVATPAKVKAEAAPKPTPKPAVDPITGEPIAATA